MRLKGFARVQQPALQYIEGTSYTNPNSQAITLPRPADGLIVELSSEGGVLYYAINAVGASAASPGYVADGTARRIGPIANPTSFHVHGAATVAHVQLFREA